MLSNWALVDLQFLEKINSLIFPKAGSRFLPCSARSACCGEDNGITPRCLRLPGEDFSQNKLHNMANQE